MGGDERVAIYDASGHVVGGSSRADMRARGLWHAAGVVLVRSGDGQRVHLHERSPDKDVFPSALDCWAGGVVAEGESPGDCAARELAEELGVRGAPLLPLFTLPFVRPPVRCHNFAYEVRWDGTVTHQPEEIVDGRWVSLAELWELAQDPAEPLVPDGRQNVLEWFRRAGATGSTRS